MYSHTPRGYQCPFCGIIRDARAGDWQSSPNAIIEVTEHLTCLIPTHYYGQIKGNALIIPNAHYENIYDIDETLGRPLLAASKRLALAMKLAFNCTGVSYRQHNEPDGNQDAWHYHMHVFPRFKDDNLYAGEKTRYEPIERLALAGQLRAALAKLGCKGICLPRL